LLRAVRLPELVVWIELVGHTMYLTNLTAEK
jgi:hypothetical protein